jgi:hypothetical protein
MHTQQLEIAAADVTTWHLLTSAERVSRVVGRSHLASRRQIARARRHRDVTRRLTFGLTHTRRRPGTLGARALD